MLWQRQDLVRNHLNILEDRRAIQLRLEEIAAEVSQNQRPAYSPTFLDEAFNDIEDDGYQANPNTDEEFAIISAYSLESLEIEENFDLQMIEWCLNNENIF